MTTVLSGLMGVCVGDALGVPVEFTSRAERVESPVDGMWGYGTWNQPAGTWSDDSSMTLCLAEALCSGYSLAAIATNFCRWYSEAHWTPHGEVFDIGNATRAAIQQLKRGTPPTESGGRDDRSNGNGSLMRILPLAFFHTVWDFHDLIQRVHEVSCITHAHPRSQIACGIYISVAIGLLQGLDPTAAYTQGIEQVQPIYAQDLYISELGLFERVMAGAIAGCSESSIESGGYVLHTLEAALWCLLNTTSYADAVLKAVNLGDDTDTTGAVTGGLAGICYGVEAIPAEWNAQIARRAEIAALAERLQQAIRH